MKAIITRISGRKFTKRLALIGILAAAPTLTMAASDPDCSRRTERNNPDCGTHNMMIVGEETIFLSHLPMFSSEHRFQVILEATFKKGGNSVDKIYFQDRKGHQQTKMYTLMPSDVFVVSRLFLGNIDSRRNSFAANIFRGHLERGGELISSLDNTRLDNTQVEIRRVVYAAELPTGPGRPNDLTYILFGKGDDLYLAHLIARAPDFDQIIRAEINGQPFAPEDLLKGIIVTVPNRPNSAAERLKTGENVDARGQLVGGNQAAPLRLKAGTEFYLEEGELKEPPDFRPTVLEKAAGFN